jgi:methylated-DNA-[protein]-cysteine S-methyltransferase
MSRTHAVIPSPIGPLTALRDDGALVGVLFDDPDHPPDPAALGRRDGAAFADVAAQLGEYFAGDRTSFDLELRVTVGDAFRRAVWEQMTLIPYGETRSYGDLARALGDRTLAQAVGAACGRNPLPVVVPCHRVVGADGSLVGFGGGLPRKRFLLDLEQRADRLF